MPKISAWNAIKNHSAYTARDPEKKGHSGAKLDWMAYVGGTRETQQLLALRRQRQLARRPREQPKVSPAELAWIEGARHAPFWSHLPATVEAVSAFLARHPLPR